MFVVFFVPPLTVFVSVAGSEGSLGLNSRWRHVASHIPMHLLNFPLFPSSHFISVYTPRIEQLLHLKLLCCIFVFLPLNMCVKRKVFLTVSDCFLSKYLKSSWCRDTCLPFTNTQQQQQVRSVALFALSPNSTCAAPFNPLLSCHWLSVIVTWSMHFLFS